MIQSVSLVPESAPFNEEQRAWLNGFLAGWIGLQGSSATGAETRASVISDPRSTQEQTVQEDCSVPWHDPALQMEERLQLAEGRPLRQQLMAAMAQLDCGSCGYDCQRYADALASGEEKSFTLCSPGGKSTSRKLKELVSLNPEVNQNEPANSKNPAVNSPSPSEPSWNRRQPFPARILGIRNLNGTGSTKQTSHVEIDLAGSGIRYRVGDALGVYPVNCKDLVREVIAELRASADHPVEIDGQTMPLCDALENHFCLSEISDDLIACLRQASEDIQQRALFNQYLESPDLIDDWDVLDLLKHHSAIRLGAQQLVSSLARMKPRLYSISSSLNAHANQVHLTVGRVCWQHRDRERKGVASTMFSDRLMAGDQVRIFVHPAHAFSVPDDPAQHLIMIGPGTGIAPFRAFLQERLATKSTGKNWLFFGDQRSATDFLYRDELESMQTCGVLNRLDVAFSRDQTEKIYVQDKMLEQGAELWKWLNEGASVFVCGDARRMAVDVDKTLRRIISQYAGLSDQQTEMYLAQMQTEKRYCRDVY